jgi:hypothetical protein
MAERLADASLAEEATNRLAMIGAKVDCAFSRLVVARLAKRTGTGALPLYDQAIAELEAAKAGYRVALACRERAELLEECGRKDDADADRVRAAQIFRAAGRATGQT